MSHKLDDRNLHKVLREHASISNALEALENKIEAHFRELVDKLLPSAKSQQDIEEIKGCLRKMPHIAGKVLLFKRIITKENELTHLKRN
jgi:hypothetical protein